MNYDRDRHLVVHSICVVLDWVATRLYRSYLGHGSVAVYLLALNTRTDVGLAVAVAADDDDVDVHAFALAANQFHLPNVHHTLGRLSHRLRHKRTKWSNNVLIAAYFGSDIDNGVTTDTLRSITWHFRLMHNLIVPINCCHYQQFLSLFLSLFSSFSPPRSLFLFFSVRVCLCFSFYDWRTKATFVRCCIKSLSFVWGCLCRCRCAIWII